MFKSLEWLVFVGAAVQLLGVLSYVKETLRGETKPNRVTWLLWTVAPLIGSFAAISAGVGWAALPVFMAGFGPLLVLIASFANTKSYWKLERFDYLCGLFSILALTLWWITKEPTVAIIFAIISDLFASVPTLIKSWKSPETETVDAYTTGAFNALTSFPAIKTWGFAEYAFPLYLIFINSTIALTIFRKKIFKAKHN